MGAARREGRRPRDRLATARAVYLLLLLWFLCPFRCSSRISPFQLFSPSADLMFSSFSFFSNSSFAFRLLPHQSPSLTSRLSMLQAISDHSVRLPESPIGPLVDHLMLPLVAPRSALCPQAPVPSSSCYVSAPAHPSTLQPLSSRPRQHRVALKPSLHVFAGLSDVAGPRRRLSMSISGRYPFPLEYFSVATAWGSPVTTDGMVRFLRPEKTSIGDGVLCLSRCSCPSLLS